MQVFDNLYFVGGDWVSAWLVKTSEGLILIDALNNAEEAAALIEGGMVKLGLDPRQIKYIVVTHGHGDHYGGARYLVDKYRPRVIASEADWNMMHGQLEFDSAAWDRPPARDMAVRDGDKVTLGDTTLTFQVTTGHTLGTLSPTFDVRAGGRTYHALLWGGTSFNFGKDFSRLRSYSANTQRMRALTARMPIDVFLSNHCRMGWFDREDETLARGWRIREQSVRHRAGNRGPSAAGDGRMRARAVRSVRVPLNPALLRMIPPLGNEFIVLSDNSAWSRS